MDRIVIGKEYEKAFDSVCKLLGESVPFDKVNVREVKDGRIVTATHEFVYSASASSEQSGRAMRFTDEGASWFETLRTGNAGAGDGTAQWLSFIESVARAYHNEYSLLEFKQPETAMNDADKERCGVVLKKVVEMFFPLLKGSSISDAKDKNVSDDIYGISLKAEMSGGTGASVPVLCSVYFRKRAASAELEPVIEAEARGIYDSLYKVIPERSAAGRAEKTESSHLIDDVLNALEKLLKGKMSYSFDECVRFGETDEKIIDELTEKLSHDDAFLECRNISVLGISHVRWTNSAFFVYHDGKPALSALVGMNGGVTLMCVNGHTVKLMDNNVISCRYTDNGGRVHKEDIRINPDAENLGLTSEQIEKIIKYSQIGKHLQSKECKNVPRINRDCKRCVCDAQMINAGTPDEPKWICTDCPYPEVAFEDAEGRIHFTPDMSFTRDKMTMTVKEETQACSCCGRIFTNAALDSAGRCELCASAKSTEEARKRYVKYRGMFSPFTRLRYLGKKKLCNEDNELIIFFMGGDKYIFDKKNMEKEGYLPAPVLSSEYKRSNAGKGGNK